MFEQKLIVPKSRDRIVVSTLRCGRSNPGSNPGRGIEEQYFFHINLLKNRYILTWFYVMYRKLQINCESRF